MPKISSYLQSSRKEVRDAQAMPKAATKRTHSVARYGKAYFSEQTRIGDEQNDVLLQRGNGIGKRFSASPECLAEMTRIGQADDHSFERNSFVLDWQLVHAGQVAIV